MTLLLRKALFLRAKVQKILKPTKKNRKKKQKLTLPTRQPNGERYYDHKLSHIEKGKLLDHISGKAVEDGFGTTPGTKPTTNSERKFNRLVSILQINSSKIVDENGEPMVRNHHIDHEGFYSRKENSVQKKANYKRMVCGR